MIELCLTSIYLPRVISVITNENVVRGGVRAKRGDEANLVKSSSEAEVYGSMQSFICGYSVCNYI